MMIGVEYSLFKDLIGASKVKLDKTTVYVQIQTGRYLLMTTVMGVVFGVEVNAGSPEFTDFESGLKAKCTDGKVAT